MEPSALDPDARPTRVRFAITFPSTHPYDDPAEHALRAAQAAARAESRARAAGVPRHPDLLRAALRGSPAPTDALAAVRDALAWRERTRTAAGARPFLRALGGPPGTGKSVALAWACVHGEGTARFAPASVADQELRSWGPDARAAKDALRQVDLLALDDAGRAADTDAIRELLALRYDDGRATLLATNLTSEDVVTRYLDARLADRLIRDQQAAPGGLAWWVPCVGPSRRGGDRG